MEDEEEDESVKEYEMAKGAMKEGRTDGGTKKAVVTKAQGVEEAMALAETSQEVAALTAVPEESTAAPKT